MRRLNIFSICLAAAIAFASGFASAQQASPEGEPAPPSTRAPVLDDPIEQEARALSGPEKLERAQEYIGTMKTTLEQTNELLEKVREEEQDILKLNCINEKLAAIKGFLKVSEQSYVNLKDAVSADDQEAQRHHYTLIAIARQKVESLGEEAQVCAGEVLRYAEDTVIDRRVDPDIADIDIIEVDDDSFDDGWATDRLPELTPFQ